jgi:hypothetical protein
MVWESRDLVLFGASNELEDHPTAVSSPVQKKARKQKKARDLAIHSFRKGR